MRRLLNNKGFSLVELMVVVAIIGILASIAIPSLQRYMAKARQSEAKTNLASLYTSEKTFFAEYNTYSTCFDGIGYQPEGKLRYRVGFSAPGQDPASYGFTTAGCNTSVMTTGDSNVCSPTGKCFELAEATSSTLPSTVTQYTTSPNTTTATPVYFAATASGKIYKGFQDVWAINDTKNLINDVDGVTGR
jgi:type IV pilus assembly protein PilA